MIKFAPTADPTTDDKPAPFYLTGRTARRSARRGYRTHKPLRSRCQRLTPKERAVNQTAARRQVKRDKKRAAAAKNLAA